MRRFTLLISLIFLSLVACKNTINGVYVLKPAIADNTVPEHIETSDSTLIITTGQTYSVLAVFSSNETLKFSSGRSCVHSQFYPGNDTGPEGIQLKGTYVLLDGEITVTYTKRKYLSVRSIDNPRSDTKWGKIDQKKHTYYQSGQDTLCQTGLNGGNRRCFIK